MSQAVDQLEKTLLNSEACTVMGLCLSRSISKSINSIPGPSSPKSSSSVSEDQSISRTSKKEEHVASTENEKQRTAEVNLHSQLLVLDHTSSANKAMLGPSVPKSSSVSEDLSSSMNIKREEYVLPAQESKLSIKIEDVESTFHTIQSFLKSLPGKYSSQQSTRQSNTTTSARTLAKLIFDCSIRLPLEALAHDPMNEKEMSGAIAALNENPSLLFSNDHVKQLVKLKYEFPVMVKKWRDLARAESSDQVVLDQR